MSYTYIYTYIYIYIYIYIYLLYIYYMYIHIYIYIPVLQFLNGSSGLVKSWFLTGKLYVSYICALNVSNLIL